MERAGGYKKSKFDKCGNVAMKINAKFGGPTTSTSIGSVFFNAPTLIFSIGFVYGFLRIVSPYKYLDKQGGCYLR